MRASSLDRGARRRRGRVRIVSGTGPRAPSHAGKPGDSACQLTDSVTAGGCEFLNERG